MAKELQARHLTVRDVAIWQVMSHQHRATANKQELGNNLEFTLNVEAQIIPAATSVADYLNLLPSLCIGYSKVGCEAVDPQPAQPEKTDQ